MASYYNPYQQMYGQQVPQYQMQTPYTTGGYTGFPGSGGIPYPSQPTGPSGFDVPGMLPIEQSYVENILRLNKGKRATVYMTFENNPEWASKVFRGIIEAAGRDHIILSDPQTGKRWLLLMIYLDYITFDEELSYEYPFTEPGM